MSRDDSLDQIVSGQVKDQYDEETSLDNFTTGETLCGSFS
jgi:hypothetical protein